MHKNAEDKAAWYHAVNPFHTMLGQALDMSKFPSITRPLLGRENAAVDDTIWTSLMSTALIAGAYAIGKKVVSSIQERKFDKKKDEIHTNKINALHAYNTPNYAPQEQAVDAVRALGVKTPLLLENKAVLAEEPKKEEEFEKVAAGTDIMGQILPPLISIPAGLWIGSKISDQLADNREKELDDKIREERNKLDALYAELLRRTSKTLPKAASDEGIEKEAKKVSEDLGDGHYFEYDDKDKKAIDALAKLKASMTPRTLGDSVVDALPASGIAALAGGAGSLALSRGSLAAGGIGALASALGTLALNIATDRIGERPTVWDAMNARTPEELEGDWMITDRPLKKSAAGEEPYTAPGLFDQLGGWAVFLPAATMALTTAAAYMYTSRHDDNRKKVSALEKQILPKNLTNAPAEVQLVLGEGGKIPTDIKEQTYIKE